MAPTVAQIANPLDRLFTRLGESHELSVYEAMERLVRAAEAVGVQDTDLLRMLDQGLNLKDLLELIEAKMRGSGKAA